MKGFRLLFFPSRLRTFLRAQTMVEYAFVVAVIAIAIVGSYELMGTDLSSLVNRLGSDVSSVA